MKKIINNYMVVVCVVVLLAASCKKIVQIPPPKNQLVSSTVFADSAGANAAVNGIYINMMSNFSFIFTNGGITLYTGLTGDEFYESTNNPTDAEFYDNSIPISNSENQQLWATAYQYIYDANACIEGIKSGVNISTTARNALTGEAMLIRAFLYFNMVNLYDGVPLVTGTDYSINQSIPRATATEVYAQIVSDLKVAQAGLSKNTSSNTRANYFAATALLAKAYLYQGQYTNAITETQQIINSGIYALESDPNVAFLAGSTETIWSFAPVQSGRQTTEGYFFVPTASGATPTYIITNSLYNSFEAGDLRKADWISVDTVSGVIYPFPYKYKTGTTTGTSTENYVVFRLADQYLIEAEAKANNNDLSGSLTDLNIIRSRAGLPPFASNDKQAVLTAIITERQHEFFCEWGNRWFDLNRLNLANSIFGAEKPNWKSTSVLFPVPQSEITLNPYLKQNPGY